MGDCKHGRLTSFCAADDGEPVPLWACAFCRHKFVPLDIKQERLAGLAPDLLAALQELRYASTSKAEAMADAAIAKALDMPPND